MLVAVGLNCAEFSKNQQKYRFHEFKSNEIDPCCELTCKLVVDGVSDLEKP